MSPDDGDDSEHHHDCDNDHNDDNSDDEDYHDCSKRATGDILTDHYSEQPDPPDKDKKMIFWARIKHDWNLLNISSKSD